MNYAGFWRRFAASIIDGIVMMIPGFIAGIVFSGTGVSAVIGFVLGFLYKPFFESSILLGTPGKALMNIAVQTEAGQQITFKQAAIRFFTSYLSGLIAGIGYLMQPFTARRQTLHDMIAETVVVKREVNAPDLNYFTVWKEQIQSVVNKL
jgi:uncharacterized RDD family membrane protein YckC